MKRNLCIWVKGLVQQLIREATGVELPHGRIRLDSSCSFEPPCRVTGDVEFKTGVTVGAFSSFGGLGIAANPNVIVPRANSDSRPAIAFDGLKVEGSKEYSL